MSEFHRPEAKKVSGVPEPLAREWTPDRVYCFVTPQHFVDRRPLMPYYRAVKTLPRAFPDLQLLLPSLIVCSSAMY